MPLNCLLQRTYHEEIHSAYYYSGIDHDCNCRTKMLMSRCEYYQGWVLAELDASILR